MARAILVNSGNANALTGDQGLTSARALSATLEKHLRLKKEEVWLASTGVIGRPLPKEKIEKALPGLMSGLSEKDLFRVAGAILTTDTCTKTLVQTFPGPDGFITLGAMAKGAGMIRPSMATMLCFVLTNALVPSPLLYELLREAVDRSFHRITIDGDTSTNDSVFLLANGQSGGTPLGPKTKKWVASFQRHLNESLIFLAREIVKDGEGATKFVTLTVRGAASREEARILAFTVAESYLVKTALFGEDANWGRLAAALGRCGVSFNPSRLAIAINGIPIVEKGVGLGNRAEDRANARLKDREIEILLDLNKGKGQETVFTCDLSYDYVRINAAYRT